MSDEMKTATLPGVEIAYYDLPAERPTGEGSGKAVLLLHGFASMARVNWVSTGWTDALRQAGYRVVASDHRGHGASQKFYTPEDYGPDIFAADALALLDHLAIERCHVMGYSMGARVTAWLAHAAPERLRCAVLGGMGEHIYGGRGGYEKIAEALEAEDLSTVDDAAALGFRTFADRVGADRLALAACIRPSEQQITPALIGGITVPTLVAVGDEDGIAGQGEPLASALPNGENFVIEGRDHMKAVGDLTYKRRVLDFFAEHDA